jgi:uncharacterized protein YcaQ
VRRIALAAQAFGAKRPDKVMATQWRKMIDWLSLHQIDSVNVLVRALARILSRTFKLGGLGDDGPGSFAPPLCCLARSCGT